METKIIVRYAETDQMGIAHHSNYAIWYEAARTDFIKLLGITYSECEKRGFMLPLISLTCNYKYPAYYEDELGIKAYIEKLTPVRLILGYEIRRNGNEMIIATGTTSHVWTDLNLKPINLMKKNIEIYNIMAKGVI